MTQGFEDATDAATRSDAWSQHRGGRYVLAFWAGGLRRHLLQPGETICVGRGETCELRLEDVSVSRRHVEIVNGESVVLRDLGSANRVHLNGVALPPGVACVLPLGAVVEFGKAALVVQELASGAVSSGAAVAGATDASMRGMARVDRLVRLVAPSMLNVLVLGETGAGKDVVAERIHRLSNRSKGPSIRLNCAALAESLLDGELFGFQKGSFTGANATKTGLIEAASGGTLFLDEVGDMPLSTQAKLLRVLEQRSVRRIGGLVDIPVDMRIVAATNRNLVEMIASGAFRQDLFFRLNGITIEVPPLRERVDEIEGLAQTFLSAAAPGVALSQNALAALLRHDWPGNVRELRSVIERAVVLCEGAVILPEHLLLVEPPRATTLPPSPAPPEASNLFDQVAQLERTKIVEALAKTGGNQSQAAELLGMSRRALITRLEQFNLPRPRRDKKRG